MGGTILESSNDTIPHGSHHSLILKIGDGVTIWKKRWQASEKNLIKSGVTQTGFVLVAIDTSECGIARLRGTHLEFMPNIYSRYSGKRYKTDFDISKFFEQVWQALSSMYKEGDKIVIFGPGETKRRFGNFIKISCVVADGIDSGGEDGIYTFSKSKVMLDIMSDSKLAKAAAIIDEIMIHASKKSRKFTMGYDETCSANKIGAVESLVFSEKVIIDNDEQAVMDFLNDAQGKGVMVYGVDSSTDIGLRVTGLGGIVAHQRLQHV